ncbi:MAG TPA: FecR family protein [Bryobacteraceae bacterium]|nr:FecR family protein [Bryobacteraceae bacterium]
MRTFLLIVLVSSAGLGAMAQAPHQAVDSSAVQQYEARATIVNGQVTRTRDQQPWALSAGERVPVRQTIKTGRDGYARFEVAGGSYFDIYSNSHVVFRENAASAGDLLDVVSGRVRIHLRPGYGQPYQRVFTPAATISTFGQEPATVAVAIDEDQTIRIDVVEGEVRIQHTLLPRGEAVLVKAVDAILVRPDEPISRRMDRGSLYRYTLKSLRGAWDSIIPWHSGNQFIGPLLSMSSVLPPSSRLGRCPRLQ